jgi:hypothetical protein
VNSPEAGVARLNPIAFENRALREAVEGGAAAAVRTTELEVALALLNAAILCDAFVVAVPHRDPVVMDDGVCETPSCAGPKTRFRRGSWTKTAHRQCTRFPGG